jgi:hypothetical protein
LVRHAASVYPEPGSNSPHNVSLLDTFGASAGESGVRFAKKQLCGRSRPSPHGESDYPSPPAWHDVVRRRGGEGSHWLTSYHPLPTARLLGGAQQNLHSTLQLLRSVCRRDRRRRNRARRQQRNDHMPEAVRAQLSTGPDAPTLVVRGHASSAQGGSPCHRRGLARSFGSATTRTGYRQRSRPASGPVSHRTLKLYRTSVRLSSAGAGALTGFCSVRGVSLAGAAPFQQEKG